MVFARDEDKFRHPGSFLAYRVLDILILKPMNIGRLEVHPIGLIVLCIWTK